MVQFTPKSAFVQNIFTRIDLEPLVYKELGNPSKRAQFFLLFL